MTDEGWLRSDKVAETIDLYMANHLANDRPRASAIGSMPVRTGAETGERAGRPQPPPRPALP